MKALEKLTVQEIQALQKATTSKFQALGELIRTDGWWYERSDGRIQRGVKLNATL